MQRPVEERAGDFERAPPAHPTTTIKATAPQAATSSDSPDSPGQGNAMLWFMLLSLLSAFALSQSYRTVTAIIATGLQTDFGLSSSSLGAFAVLFGLAFGVTQFFMGIGMDLYGLRRTVLSVFPLAVVGAALSAWAPQYGWLMLGQLPWLPATIHAMV